MEPGAQLGHYSLLSEIGRGGMGVVWKAKDEKLGREVAIKTLPPEFAQDADRLARFEREAKLLASLNHPNIAAIYGLEEHEGTRFLVLELVEGDTLADRIQRGAVPVEESLKLALQMADALESAHDKGVIHRDLKPANVKVTPDGRVKVLDFGLAKAFVGDEKTNPSNSPTLSIEATQQGLILGTAGYMSPEQARGENAGQRADVWAFGVVLFEMLTGASTFDGKTVSDILAAVLAKEPAWQSLPANLHPRLRQLLERCLEKEARNRYSGISDARVDIQSILADPAGPVVEPLQQTTADTPAAKGRTLIAIAAALVLAAVTGFAAWTLKQPGPGPIVRWEHPFTTAQTLFASTPSNVLAISPNGEYFVYAAQGGIRLRSMNALEDRAIPGTEGALRYAPTLSPDGRALVFADGVQRELMRINISGGAPVPLARIETSGIGLSWEADGTLLYETSAGIFQVSTNGGEPELLIPLDADEISFGPRRLPNGDWILYSLARTTESASWDSARIIAESPSSGERRVLLRGGSSPRYVPTGHLVYVYQDVLFAAPFDIDALEVTGSAVSIVEGVRRTGRQSGAAYYDFAPDGTLVYVPSGRATEGNALAWINASGNAERIDLPAGFYAHPRISPSGEWLAVELESADGTDIWVYRTDGETGLRRLTEGGNRFPVWSRDGEYVAFQSESDGGIFVRRADGTGSPDRLTTPEPGTMHVPEAWSPIEDLLTYAVLGQEGTELWLLNTTEGTSERFGDVVSISPLFRSSFSPEGDWIAYQQVGSVGTTGWVASLSDVQTRFQIGQDEDLVHHPLWSRDGGRIVYFSGSNRPVAVDIQTDPTIGLSRPEPVAGLPLNATPDSAVNHDQAPDGRFVTVLPRADAEGLEVTESVVVVMNWFEELKERVPVN